MAFSTPKPDWPFVRRFTHRAPERPLLESFEIFMGKPPEGVLRHQDLADLNQFFTAQDASALVLHAPLLKAARNCGISAFIM